MLCCPYASEHPLSLNTQLFIFSDDPDGLYVKNSDMITCVHTDIKTKGIEIIEFTRLFIFYIKNEDAIQKQKC